MYALQKIEELGQNCGLNCGLNTGQNCGLNSPFNSLSIEAMLENPDAAIRLLMAWKELADSPTSKQPASSPRKPQSRPGAKTHNFAQPDTADQYIAVRDIKLPDAMRSSMTARQQTGRKLTRLSILMGYEIKSSPGAARTYNINVVNAFLAGLEKNQELLGEYRMMSF